MDKLKAVFDLVKGKWKEIAIILVVGVVSSWVTAFIKADVTKTAIKNPDQKLVERNIKLENEITQLKKDIKAGRKVLEKFENGELIWRETFDNFVETLRESTSKTAKTENDKKLDTKISYPRGHKMWQIGGGYDIFSGDWYIRGAIETGTALFIELQYPILFDGKNRVKVGAGIHF